MATLEKAYIESVDGSVPQVEFAFNPKEYSISRSNKYKRAEQKGKDVPRLEFESGEGRKMTFELFVDEYESQGNVQDFVDKLEKLARVVPSTEAWWKMKKGKPPYVRFRWGRETLFKSFIESLNVTYTLFHPDGRPARAKIAVTIVEVADEPEGQNPSSRGARGRGSHVVLPGETLDQIAHRELGAAQHWKHVAETNGIDDPWALRAGQRLVIEPVE